MSRSRRAKQQEDAAQQAAAYLRQRQALAPTRMAYHVHTCYPGALAWNHLHAAHWVIAEHRRVHAVKTHDGIVNPRR